VRHERQADFVGDRERSDRHSGEPSGILDQRRRNALA